MKIFTIGETIKYFDSYHENKYFASIVALTMTAKQAQAELKKELAKKFILKNKYTESGVRIQAATKSNPVAYVFHKDVYIAHHEGGGIRTRKFPAYIPMGRWKGLESARSILGLAENKVIPKSLRAQSLIGKKQFKGKPVYVGKSSTGKDGVFIGRGSDRRMLYLIRKSPVMNEKRPWFFVTTEKTYLKNIEKNILEMEKKYVK